MEEEQFQEPNKFQRFIKETVRVLRITKKPDLAEYKSLLKITGLGCGILGLIGFVIFLLKELLF